MERVYQVAEGAAGEGAEVAAGEVAEEEAFNCPPVLLITGRAQDNWLATWSRAEATVTHPIDPFTLARKCSEILISNNLSNATTTK